MTDPQLTPGTPSGDDHSGAGGSKPTGGAGLFDSLRDAFDDLTERATPTVREVSARAAELTAAAATKAAPLARKAGDATADASGKLAERSRTWAAELRSSISGEPGETTGTATATADAPVAASPSETSTPNEIPPVIIADAGASATGETNGATTHDGPETPAN